MHNNNTAVELITVLNELIESMIQRLTHKDGPNWFLPELISVFLTNQLNECIFDLLLKTVASRNLWVQLCNLQIKSMKNIVHTSHFSVIWSF